MREGHDQEVVRDLGDVDYSDGGREKEDPVVQQSLVHGSWDQEGGFSHGVGQGRAVRGREEKFMSGGQRGLSLDGRVQQGGATHGGEGTWKQE